MNTFMQKKAAGLFALMLGLLLMNPVLAGKPAAASPLATDLQALVTEGNTLNSQLAGITLAADTLCGDLLHANQAANDYLNSIAAVEAGVAGPLSLDADILQALEDLSAVFVSLGSEAVRLSTDLNTLSRTAEQINIAEGISAMLRLSDDIGVMADRIGEMADNILVMADNIGLMADRILLTQQIQNENVALTQASILTTQQNAITLVSVLDTAAYNTDLSNLFNSTSLLSFDMHTMVLTAFNMARELTRIETDVTALKDQIIATDDAISVDAASNTLTINQTTLTTLMDLSAKTAALATALEGYAIVIDGLAAITSTPTLYDAMGSMLRLSEDIGIMADRILEMSDQILAMADNIGVQADQIVLTQQLQNTNIAATQAAILAAQQLTIVIIAAFAL